LPVVPCSAEDRRTCILPVKLQPGKTYAVWVNSQKFRNFRDAKGQPAVPYLLVFKTKG
jgi:RNA polymerase sigma-70 factor (ECF subfamily)